MDSIHYVFKTDSINIFNSIAVVHFKTKEQAEKAMKKKKGKKVRDQVIMINAYSKNNASVNDENSQGKR